MPDIGGDASNWGNVLNATTTAIDSVVYANQQAGVPIGSITMFGGAAAPANWVLCQGQSVATTGTYAALFAILGYAFGGSGANFNLPNFTDIFPIGASATHALAATGGAATVTLDATMIPTHTHTATSTQRRTATASARNASSATASRPAATRTASTIHPRAYVCDAGRRRERSPGSGGNLSNAGNTGAAGNWHFDPGCRQSRRDSPTRKRDRCLGRCEQRQHDHRHCDHRRRHGARPTCRRGSASTSSFGICNVHSVSPARNSRPASSPRRRSNNGRPIGPK